jgi:hypothetical protein
MKTIISHKDGNRLNDAIEITAVGEPGSGGAHFRYDVIGHAEHVPNIGPRPFGVNLRFQEGPVTCEKDMNGITNEALLAVVIDRLKSFQLGPFECEENQMALQYVEMALQWLKNRTSARIERGVEGTLLP